MDIILSKISKSVWFHKAQSFSFSAPALKRYFAQFIEIAETKFPRLFAIFDYYKMKMSSAFIYSFIIIALIFTTNSQVLNSWASPLSTVTMHATFITTVTIGSSITGSVTVSGKQSYTVYFYRPNQYYPNSPAFQFTEHAGSDKFASRPVDATGLWRVEVMPSNPHEIFLILVSVGSGKEAEQYVDVARKVKLLVGYFQQGENCNFTVQGIAYGQERDYQVEMYYGGASLDFARSNQIFSNAGMANTEYEVACTAPTSGYYYIFLSVSEDIMSLFPRVLVNYQSDNYPCPAPSTYKDANQLFPNCVQLNLNTAYPCLRYDNSANGCTQCQERYTLEEGSCYLSVDCGLDNYFHLGNCLPAPSNCQDFKQIGGDCIKCANGYALINSPQGKYCYPTAPPSIPQNPVVTQASTNPSNSQQSSYSAPTVKTNTETSQTAPTNVIKNVTNQSNSGLTNTTITTRPPKTPVVTCDQGTYLFNGLCVLFPPHCSQFDPVQLICTACARAYTIDPSSLSCILIRVNCLPFFTNIGNTCVPFPSHCNSTNAFGNCTSCVINYSLDNSGNCIAKQCAARQYLSYNRCLPVNVNCNDYDPYNGNCLSCLNNHILAANGTCNPPQYNQMVSNGCRPRQYRSGNTCSNVDPTCNLYDQYTGFCLSCIDPARILDKSSGKCYSISEVCADRYYLDPITRTCMQVSQYCSTFDPATGYCLSCMHGLTLFRGGCMLLTPCGRNQYRNQDGICTDADPNCDGVDQVTGGCIACQPGYEINPGGICCYSQNYLLSPSCKAFLAVNCISQRPIFLNCQECAAGYSLSNGVFGKCRKH